MSVQPRNRLSLSPLRVFALASLVCALAFLGTARLSQAATWYINPHIQNATGSGTENCAGHQGWTGCILEEENWVEGGEFIANPDGPTGGRHEVATNFEPEDQPAFDAPHFDEGAEGHFAYRMPDGNLYGLLAIDDTNGLGVYPTAMPLCTALPGSVQSFACLATQEPGDKTDPSSEHFNPEFTFTPLTSAAFTAAGQRCVVPAYQTVDCTAGNGWSPLDTGAYMYLQFEELSSSPEVIVSESTRPGHDECNLTGAGSKCELVTYTEGSNVLQVANHGGTQAEVMVLAEGEEPKDLATEEKAELVGLIIEGIAEGLKALEEEGGDFAVGATPRLSGLQVTKASAAASTALASKPGSGITVSYRDDHRATSVFTVSRALPGGGWSPLGGLRVRAASDSYSALHGRRSRHCPGGAKRTGQGSCHLKLKLYGHLRHRDRAGRNHLSFRGVDGKALAPGRYRLTAVALLHTRQSKPVSRTFTVGTPAARDGAQVTDGP